MDSKKVLVVVNGAKNRKSMDKYINDTGPYDFCSFLYNPTLPPEEFDLERVYKDCCDIIRREKVKVIVSINDLGSLVHAALCMTFPHIPGPSFLSVFTCHHKLMTKTVGRGWNIPYKSIKVRPPGNNNIPSEAETREGSMNGVNYIGQSQVVNGHPNKDEAFLETYQELSSKEQEVQTGAGRMGYPCLIKPCLGSDSLLVKKVDDLPTLLHYLAKCSHLLPHMLRPLQSLVNQFLDPALQKDVLDCHLVVEELVEGADVCNVDGMVLDGQVQPWVISDNFYWPHRPRCFLGIGVPTQQPQVSGWVPVLNVVNQCT